MTIQGMRTSGTSKSLPTILKYPVLHPFNQVLAHVRNHLCYILKHYGTKGLAVVITRQPKLDKVALLFGDWNGNNIDLAVATPHQEAALQFIKDDLQLFLRTMQVIKLDQAQFFFAFSVDGLILTDIQISINKLCGPGLVRDLFGKNYRVPEVIKVEIFDDRVIEYMEKGTGSYAGDFVIKPSKFSMFTPTKTELVPLYAEVRR